MTEAVLHGQLLRCEGRLSAPVPYVGRWLAPDEVGGVIALHHAIRQLVAPELLCRETDAFFHEHCRACGRILGLFANAELIGYGVLGLPKADEESFADQFGLTAEQRAAVATIDGSGILPRWRGNGLQRQLVAARIQAAGAAGRRIAVSTVAPGNLPSLRNLLAEGLTIRAVRPAFGGLRFMMRRDLDWPPKPATEGRWIALSDTSEAKAALMAGYQGWSLSEAAARPRIWYAMVSGPVSGMDTTTT